MKRETSHKFAALMALLMERGLSRDDARLQAVRLLDSYSEYVSEWFEIGWRTGPTEEHLSSH